jgi:hypothetical protein
MPLVPNDGYRLQVEPGRVGLIRTPGQEFQTVVLCLVGVGLLLTASLAFLPAANRFPEIVLAAMIPLVVAVGLAYVVASKLAVHNHGDYLYFDGAGNTVERNGALVFPLDQVVAVEAGARENKETTTYQVAVRAADGALLYVYSGASLDRARTLTDTLRALVSLPRDDGGRGSLDQRPAVVTVTVFGMAPPPAFTERLARLSSKEHPAPWGQHGNSLTAARGLGFLILLGRTHFWPGLVACLFTAWFFAMTLASHPSGRDPGTALAYWPDPALFLANGGIFLLLALFGATVCVVGLAACLVGLGRALRGWRLLRGGRVAEGAVLAVTGRGGRHGYRLVYEYRDQHGRTRGGQSHRLTGAEALVWRVGDRGEVRFDSLDTARSLWASTAPSGPPAGSTG